MQAGRHTHARGNAHTQTHIRNTKNNQTSVAVEMLQAILKKQCVCVAGVCVCECD